LKRYSDAFFERFRGKVAVQVENMLLKIHFCRTEVATIDWAVYIQPPPKESSRAEHVVRYLARYMTGGPISDKRLIRLDQHDNVWFWARSKDKSGGREQVHLSAIGFVQQWSLHVLPRGYTKVRSFGQWA